MRVLAVIPCLDEAPSVGALVRAMPAAVTQTLVVDDGSRDDTAEVARREGARVLRNERTRGVGASLRRGFQVAVAEGFDVVVVLAGSGKDDPREIPRLLEPIAASSADLVQGSRYLGRPASLGAMPTYRRLATRLHPALFGLATGHLVSESTNGFRAVHRRVLADPRLSLEGTWLDGYQLEPWLYAQALALGYRALEVPVRKVYPRLERGTATRMPAVTGWLQLLEPLALSGLRRVLGHAPRAGKGRYPTT